jgi:hypothetical protein
MTHGEEAVSLWQDLFLSAHSRAEFQDNSHPSPFSPFVLIFLFPFSIPSVVLTATFQYLQVNQSEVLRCLIHPLMAEAGDPIQTNIFPKMSL